MRRGSLESACTVEQACAQLEQATSQTERKNAEVLLLAFRAAPQPYRVCEHLLTRSTSAAAQFQAASTIKEALLREWPALTPEFVTALRDSLLLFVANRPQTAPAVRRQVLHVVAVVFKRGFFRGGDGTGEIMSMMLLEQLTALLAADIGKKLCALDLILAVLEEFELTSNTSSILGLPWEFHEKCHHCLEAHTLPPLLRMVMGLCEGALGVPVGQRGAELAKILEKCAKIIRIILGWSFDEAVSDYALAIRTSKMTESEKLAQAYIASTPPLQWAPLLVHSRLLETLFKLHSEASGSVAEDSRLALVSLASLQGSVFQDRDTQNKFAVRIWNHFQPVAVAALRSVQDEDVMGWLCHFMHCFAVSYSLASIMALPQPEQFIGLLGDLTLGLIRLQNPAFREAFLSTLATWEALSEQIQRSRAAEPLVKTMATQAQLLIPAYVEGCLSVARSDEEMPDRLEGDCVQLAGLGRRALGACLSFLSQGVRARAQQLQRASQGANPIEIRGIQREALVFLRLLTEIVSPQATSGRAEFDDDDPTGFLECTATSSSLPFVSLPLEMSRLIAQVEAVPLLLDVFGAPREYAIAEDALIAASKPHLEIRTSHGLLWFLSGWSSLYMSPASSSSLRSSFPAHYPFSSGQHGAAATEFVLQKVWSNLQSFAGETFATTAGSDAKTRAKIAERLCKRSLNLFVRLVESSKSVCTHVVASQAWKQFVHVHTTRALMGENTDPGLLKPLVRAMVHVCSETQQLPSGDLYRAVVCPIEAMFSAVMAAVKAGTRPSREHHRALRLAVSMFRGVASTGGRANYELTAVTLSSSMGAFLEVWAMVHELEPDTVAMFIWGLSAVAKAKLPFMQPGDMQGFATLVMRTLKLYSQRIAAGAPQWGEQVRATLGLLTNLLSFEAGERKQGSSSEFIAEAVLTSVADILPTITQDTLGLPGLLGGCLTLFRTLTQRHSRKLLLMLQQPALLNCLLCGLQHPVPENVELALEVVQNLAKFVLQEPALTNVFAGVIPQFSHSLITLLLVGRIDPKLLDPIADALQPLIIADPPVFFRVAQEFVREREVEAKHQSQGVDADRLKERFVALTEGQDLSPQQLNAKRDAFRASVRYFTRSTRALLASK